MAIRCWLIAISFIVVYRTRGSFSCICWLSGVLHRCMTGIACCGVAEAGGRDVVADSVKMLEAVGTTTPVLVRLVIGAEGVEIQEPPENCGTIGVLPVCSTSGPPPLLSPRDQRCVARGFRGTGRPRVPSIYASLVHRTTCWRVCTQNT